MTEVPLDLWLVEAPKAQSSISRVRAISRRSWKLLPSPERSRALKPGTLTARSALPAGEIVDILTWERRFAHSVPGGYVNPVPLERALAQLTTAAESIKKYVDRHVAHRDRRPLATMPTFIDLNEAIDHLGELSGKCELLLHGADRVPMPGVLGDVMDAFSVPWVPAKPRLPR